MCECLERDKDNGQMLTQRRLYLQAMGRAIEGVLAIIISGIADYSSKVF